MGAKINRKMKISIKDLGLDLGADILGSLIFALGLVCFVEPARIAPGGISGVAIMVNYIAGFPIGLLSILINVPLVLLALVYLGKSFTLKTIKSLVISSVFIDYVVAPLVPMYTGDRLLGSVFGGLLMGVGLAVIFLRGSTTGGTDIVSYLVQMKFPQVSIGRAILFVDCLILGASMLVFKDIEAGLYGVISLFCMSKVIDGIIYGIDKGSMVTVVSAKNDVIADRIIKEIDRGVTLLNGTGAYTGNDVQVLLCAVRKMEYAKLKKIVYEVDYNAFVIVSEVGEILGEGFKEVK